MKEKKCFIFMPKKFVGFDSMLPFVMSLLDYKNWKITCVFWKMEDLDELKRVPAYYDMLSDNVEILILREGYLYVTFSNLFILAYRFMFSSKPKVISFAEYSTSGYTRKLLEIMYWMKGTLYIVPGSSSPMSMEYFNNYYLKALNNNRIREFLGKGSGRYSVQSGSKKYIGTPLLQNKYEDERFDFIGYPKKRQYLGYYKLFPSWDKCIKKYKKFDTYELDSEKKCIVIIVKKGNKYFFEKEDDYKELLEDTINSIRNVYSDTLIIIKPKAFKTIGTNDWVSEYVSSFNDENMVVDYTPLSFTATKTIFAVFNIASTAYFDFAMNSVPCIEYSRYGKIYKEINPGGSYMKEYGAFITSKREEFEGAMSDIKRGKFSVFTRKKLENKIGHNNSTDAFLQL